MNFNDDTSDDSIIISQDHEQTPVGTSAALGTSAAAALASLLNQMTPEELSHLKRQVYKYIKFDRDWKKVQSILKKYPDMVHIPLFTGRASTAFHEAVNVRNAGIVEGLVNLMTPEDLLIPYSDGLLPVHVAALFGHRTIVQFLSSENLLNLMAPKGIEQLFFISMESNMFGARASSSSEVIRELFAHLWSHVKELEYHRYMELITQPSIVLFDAVKSGNTEVELDYSQQCLHTFESMECHLLQAVDNEGNNILHLAVHLPVESEPLSGSRASIQMERDSKWFKEVDQITHGELGMIRNNEGKRPMDVFYDKHKQLSKEIKVSDKGIAQNGMFVATIIAAIAFSATCKAPGDKEHALFPYFLLANGFTFFTSSTLLLLLFLSIFTSSRFGGSKCVDSPHSNLSIGNYFLFTSIFAMNFTFVMAVALIFDHPSKKLS